MERNKLARQIIDTCLEMTRLGLNQGTAGNVSVRYQDGMQRPQQKKPGSQQKAHSQRNKAG